MSYFPIIFKAIRRTLNLIITWKYNSKTSGFEVKQIWLRIPPSSSVTLDNTKKKKKQKTNKQTKKPRKKTKTKKQQKKEKTDL